VALVGSSIVNSPSVVVIAIDVQDLVALDTENTIVKKENQHPTITIVCFWTVE
jgi:hypothetical protein